MSHGNDGRSGSVGSVCVVGPTNHLMGTIFVIIVFHFYLESTDWMSLN